MISARSGLSHTLRAELRPRRTLMPWLIRL